MTELRQLRKTLVWLVLVGATAGSLGLLLVSLGAAKGYLLGSIAGLAGLWPQIAGLEKVATSGEKTLQYSTLALWTVRMVVYGVVLWAGYRLDPASLHGLWASAAGLFSVQAVLVGLVFWEAHTSERLASER